MATKTKTKVRYFTKDTLILANRVAIKTKRNRTLYEDKLEELPDGLRFPVGFVMPHNDCEMRVSIAVGPSAMRLQRVWLDIPFETYEALPFVEVESA